MLPQAQVWGVWRVQCSSRLSTLLASIRFSAHVGSCPPVSWFWPLQSTVFSSSPSSLRRRLGVLSGRRSSVNENWRSLFASKTLVKISAVCWSVPKCWRLMSPARCFPEHSDSVGKTMGATDFEQNHYMSVFTRTQDHNLGQCRAVDLKIGFKD